VKKGWLGSLVRVKRRGWREGQTTVEAVGS
jgi:hypothetical protein